MASSSSSREIAPPDQTIFGRYHLERLLTVASHIQIWAASDDAGIKYGVKLTTLAPDGNSRSSYQAELEVFLTLTRGRITPDHSLNIATPHGFPKIFFYGRHAEKYDVIVTGLLSATIHGIRNDIRWRPLATTTGYLMRLDDMIFSIMTLHQHGFVHRNVKPHNFRITNSFLPILLNFSVAKRYIDLVTGHHVPMRRENILVGSLKYASIHAHRLFTQSRRDDLISLGYAIIDSMKGSLPWDRVTRTRSRSEVFRLVVQAKENIPLQVLCQDLPNGILLYMQTVTSLSYHNTPDYSLLRFMIRPSNQ